MRVVLTLLCVAAAAYAGPRSAVDAFLEESDPLRHLPSPPLSRVVAAADEGGPSPWSFEAALYLWATGFDGSIGAKGTSASVDVPFSELFQDLQGAFMGQFGARRGRWRVLADIFWCSLEDETTGPLGGTNKAEVDLFLGELTGSYTVLDRGEAETGRFALDLYAGARVYSADTKITTALVSASDSATWVDPIVGVEARFRTHRWAFGLRGDVGGFGVSSEFAWCLTAGVSYRCTKVLSLAAGYRLLDIHFESGGVGFLDAQLGGPFLAAVFTW